MHPWQVMLILTLLLVAILASALFVASAVGLRPRWIKQEERAVGIRLGWIKAGGHSAAAMAAVAASAPAAADSGPVPPTEIGVSLTTPNARFGRVFANLAIGGKWQGAGGDGEKAQPVTTDFLDADGNVTHLPPGGPLFRLLSRPNTGSGSVTVRCTYTGKGGLMVMGGGASRVSLHPGEIRFDWTNRWDDRSQVKLRLDAVDAADPIRNLDCREAGMASDARFDPAFVRFLGGFKLLRFMDWQNTNNNPAVTWATRHTPRSIDLLQDDGVSLEDMAALVKQAHADAWFNMPWRADDDYIRRFAQFMHDALPADRKVYVEAGNEVWNWQFATTKLAAQEGQAEGLSDKPRIAMLARYSERLAHVMDIWSKVFADDPSRLVRLAATQSVTPQSAELVLGFKDTARHIDALATAPYFGHDVMKAGETGSADEVFGRLPALIDAALDHAAENKAIAHKYGKHYVAYEAGQHVVMKDNLDLEEKVERDPRMYDLYTRYLDGWRARIGDEITIFSIVFPIGKFGAWGLVEHDGQPESEAPKLRAVREELAR